MKRGNTQDIHIQNQRGTKVSCGTEPEENDRWNKCQWTQRNTCKEKLSKLCINTDRLFIHYWCSENFLDHGCLLKTTGQCSSEVNKAHRLRTEQRTKPRDICVWFYNSMRCLHPDFHIQSYWKGYSRKRMVKDSQRYCPPSKWRGNSRSLFLIVQGLRDMKKQDRSEGVTPQKETSFLLSTL